MEASYQVGYESFLMTVDSFHTVCIFKQDGLYYHNSNYKGVRGSYESLKDIAKSIKVDYKTYTLRDRQLKVIK